MNSGLLLNTFKKAIPQGASEIEIMLRLKSHFGSMIGTGGANIVCTISNPRIYCPVYRINNSSVSDSYNAMIAQSGISWIGESAKTYINSMANTANNHVFQINDRSNSLLALVTAIRDNDADTARLNYSNSATNIVFSGGHVNQFYYQLLGISHPQSQITMSTDSDGLNCGRAYEECVKCFGEGGKYAQAQPGLTQFKSVTNAWTSTVATGAISSGKGLIAISLKKWDDQLLRYVGINTANSSTPGTLNLNMSAAPGAVKDVTTFALIECVYVMNPNGSLSVIQ